MITKPIQINTDSADEANKIADAIKTMLSNFSNSEIIKMGSKIANPIYKNMIKGYLK